MPVPVITLPLLPLSKRASTDSWSILFSFLTIMSGALRSKSLFNRLFLLITLRYKSFKSDVANLPPSRGTNGLNSGGITGTVVKIIHSGLFPDSMKDSISFNRFIVLSSVTFDLIVSKAVLNFFCSLAKSKLIKISLTASAPIPAWKASSPNSSCALINCSSEINWPFLRVVNPGSTTMKLSKYNTLSTSLSFMSTARAIRLGNDFKNHIWATGQAKSICPILSLLTLDFVISTPHFSHIIPLNFILLYLPHKHS